MRFFQSSATAGGPMGRSVNGGRLLWGFFRAACQLPARTAATFSASRWDAWTAGTGGVNHAIDLAALSGDHRDHEAIVADGDELLLQHALLAVRAQEALQRLVDVLLLSLDIAAQAAEGDAGMIGHAAVGQDLAIQFAQQSAELADGGGAASQQRKALGDGGQQRLGVGGHVQQGEQLEDLDRLEAGPWDR